MNRKSKRNCLSTIEVEENNEVITNVEINEWEWKSYHKIDVKQNMGNGRHIENIEINGVIMLKIWRYNLPKFILKILNVCVYIYINYKIRYTSSLFVV